MRAEERRGIPELSRVALRRPHECAPEGKVLPEGATGTVVIVYRGGAGYEVEFARPFHCLVTVQPDEITRV